MKNFDIEQFFPPYLTYVESHVEDNAVTLYFETNRSKYACPEYGCKSYKPLTMYTKKLQDKSLFDAQTKLHIKLRKYVCANINCSKKVFAERIDDFALPRQRQTNRLNEVIKTYGLTHHANSVTLELKFISVLISSSTVIRY